MLGPVKQCYDIFGEVTSGYFLLDQVRTD